MSDPLIAPLARGETAAAVALWQACGLTRPWNDPAADIALALATPSSTVLALRRDDRLAATVMVGSDGHRGWIYYLAVDPAVRRRGVGARMVRAAEDWLASRGVPKAMLMIRPENEAVAAFYRALGYGEEERIVMSRRLDGA